MGLGHRDYASISVRENGARGHRYHYLADSIREGKEVRQRTIRALGRMDVLHASGKLNRVIGSPAGRCERAMELSHLAARRLV